jgi:photoactive yellow protein
MTITATFHFENGDTERLDAMSGEDFDSLPFGVIRLDPAGSVLAYNRTESEHTGLQPRAVIGRNFFRELAPCANTAKFLGKFKDGVTRGEIDVIFDYTFTRLARPSVRIHMLKAPGEDFWLLIDRL